MSDRADIDHYLTNELLPDFCQGRAVFVLVLVAELFVLAMVLASSGIKTFSWDYLALVSLFVQWVVLLSAMCLCGLKRYLRDLPPVQTVIVVFAIILTITALASLVADWVMAGADLSVLRPSLNGANLLRNLIISAIMTGMVLRYLYVQARLRRQEQAELKSRIEALQSRIRPHFLFNSMNSIASLITTNPQAAERAIVDLSELFRASLKGAEQPVPISREIELCKHYIAIEKLRLGERLTVNWQIEELPGSTTIPLLLLQPLLENAIYHGIQPLPEGGEVNVLIQNQGGNIVITLTNPHRSQRNPVRTEGNHVALGNIRSRLSAYYGGLAKLSTHLSDGLFVTQVSYPAER